MARLVRVGLVTVAWIACVVGVAVTSWLAIDSAGRQVGVTIMAEGKIGTPRASTSLGSALTSPATPTGAATGSGSASDGADRGTDEDQDRSLSSPTTPVARPSETTSTPAPSRVSDSFETRGGVVELSCQSAVISDYRVQPEPGWSAHAEKESATLLEVTFRHDDQRIDVDGSCATGVPVFQLDVHHEHD